MSKDPTINRYKTNILAVYNRASDTDLVTGLNWYREAYHIAYGMESNSVALNAGNGTVGAGVIAALSPLLPWKRNLELAAQALREGKASGTFQANCDKADKIIAGADPMKVLWHKSDRARKTVAFYESIIAGGITYSVCIDRHAGAICEGRDLTEAERKSLRDGRYRDMETAYQLAAKQVGLYPAQLQAITWVTHRREKGITD